MCKRICTHCTVKKNVASWICQVYTCLLYYKQGELEAGYWGEPEWALPNVVAGQNVCLCLYGTSCHKSLSAHILCILASCVNSKWFANQSVWATAMGVSTGQNSSNNKSAFICPVLTSTHVASNVYNNSSTCPCATWSPPESATPPQPLHVHWLYLRQG